MRTRLRNKISDITKDVIKLSKKELPESFPVPQAYKKLYKLKKNKIIPSNNLRNPISSFFI